MRPTQADVVLTQSVNELCLTKETALASNATRAAEEILDGELLAFDQNLHKFNGDLKAGTRVIMAVDGSKQFRSD